MFDEKGRFTIDGFQKKPPFSSFLPGISGQYGIPVWSFYVNRGQGIASFGSRDKDHSILEFCPAHTAYQTVSRMGFRTFLLLNGQYYEPFRDDAADTVMHIGMNELELEETNPRLGLKIRVLYYTLPEEKIGALARTVRIENLTDRTICAELLDGLPAVIPYGISLADVKEMLQTMTAWMQAEDVAERRPYYRTRFSTKDSSKVGEIRSGNFAAARTETGEELPVIADPELIFDQDTSFEKPFGWIRQGGQRLTADMRNLNNQVPCAFLFRTLSIGKGETSSTFCLYGQAEDKKCLHAFLSQKLDENYFEKKYKRAAELTANITDSISTVTASPVFDAYCRQTYLDNILRGGMPVKLGEKDVFYIYARKHGDLERDYNYFVLLPEFLSQGNGNYRDVIQNRRSDILFAPWTGNYNIRLFLDLIQMDGYNPLVIQQTSYRCTENKELLLKVEENSRDILRDFLQDPFTPGQLFLFLEENGIKTDCSADEWMSLVADSCRQELSADFTEGYWVDHWTYVMDLIEAYLCIYPDCERELLFGDAVYRYYHPEMEILPRKERYTGTEQGIRQYHFTRKKQAGEGPRQQWVVTADGREYTSCLFAKLFILAADKFSALDMNGMGLEMEAGKPGWYDALNGLPAMFGSSMADTYELKRLLGLLLGWIRKYEEMIRVPEEACRFIRKLSEIASGEENETDAACLLCWDERNAAKEEYRSRTRDTVSGTEEELSCQEIQDILKNWLRYTESGIRKALHRDMEDVPPTYFSYAFTDYTCSGNSVLPDTPKVLDYPPFLEGSVHYMKLLGNKQERRSLYRKVRASGLFDRELSMYRLNDSLEKVSYEAGRARAFTDGWLENGSIWLHMEYKYLLELLKGELYPEFFAEMKQVCIPFLDFQRYGRSILENSSFLVSSSNSNEKLHGRGYCARLSGASAEFLQIWNVMMHGRTPFCSAEEGLVCTFMPAVPDYLIPENLELRSRFLGTTEVVYRQDRKVSLIPGQYTAEKTEILFADGRKQTVPGGSIRGKMAEELRAGKVAEIVVQISTV